MSNLTCEQFKALIELYNLKYVCRNYDIYCDSYCMEYDEGCHCGFQNNGIYCVNYFRYALALFSVVICLFLLCACFCYGCMKCWCKGDPIKQHKFYSMFSISEFYNISR
jgi:hypothetical protein